jgi:tetratricopeptide (TPR) repeat protein
MTVMRWVSAVALASLGLAACGGGREAAWETTPAKVASGSQQADAVTQAKAAAEAAWAERDAEAKLREAITHWEKVVELDPKDHESWAKLTRAVYFLADGHIRFHTDEKAEEDMLATFEKAVTAAERGLMALSEPFTKKMQEGAKIEEAAKTLDKTGVPLLYWRASALGKWAAAKGFATLLSYKDEIKDVMQICLDKDPTYFHSGPDRYFGVFYARAPGFAGGDLAKSRVHFDKSLANEPNYLGTHVLMAEDLAVKAQDKKLFEEHIDYVLKADPAVIPEIAPENRIEQKKAKELLTKKDELFE